MEFAVAVFAVVTEAALSKLCKVTLKLVGQPKIDATFIRDELLSIKATIKDATIQGARHVSCLERARVAELRRLAYDIEDCIDCFDAEKTSREQFATQIAELKGRSLDFRHRYSNILAEGPLIFFAQGSSAVPQELQVLIGESHLHKWLAGNMECLLYLCLFPSTHHVRSKSLMRRWVAEGLVKGEQGAVHNLGILVNYNIISSIQISNNGKVKRCQPTEEVLQCISQQCMSENFILLPEGRAQFQAEMQFVRRISVHPTGAANGEVLHLPEDLSHLRTLAVFPAGAIGLDSYQDVLDFNRYQVLRVLDLKECAPISYDHVLAICDQVLMKYLSINLGNIDRIGRKIADMTQLETLDVSRSKVVTVFKEVLMLPKLKHLLGKFQLSRVDSMVFGTRNVENFLESKSVLDTVAGFVTGQRPGFPQLMGFMRQLRKVKIWCKANASHANLEAISSAITIFIRKGAQNLGRSLSIDFQECSGQFLDTVVADTGSHLASLKLRGNLPKNFPPFVSQLAGFMELCLWSTGLSWIAILVGLKELKVLKYLKLIEDNLGQVEILSEHLKSLERICLVSGPSLNITIQAGALSQLVSLHLLCQLLDVSPGTRGIEITHMKDLKEVALHPQVQDEVRINWQNAANSHSRTPDVLFIQGPQ